MQTAVLSVRRLAAMFRSFRTERSGRVEKAPRPKRAVRDQAKLEKLKRSFGRGDDGMTEAEPVQK